MEETSPRRFVASRTTFIPPSTMLSLKIASRDLQEKNCEPVEDLSTKIKKIKWCDWLLGKVKQIAVIYIDNFKDIMLVVSIIAVVGVTSLYNFPNELSSVVVFCLIFTIISPMLLSSFILAVETIEESQETLSWFIKTKIVAKNLSLFLLNPIRLITRLEKVRDNLKKSAMENKTEEVLTNLDEEMKNEKEINRPC